MSQAYGCQNSKSSQDRWVLGKLTWGGYATIETPWLPNGIKPLSHFDVIWSMLSLPLKDEGNSGCQDLRFFIERLVYDYYSWCKGMEPLLFWGTLLKFVVNKGRSARPMF